MIITAYNPSLDGVLEVTYLSAVSAAAATTLTVKNNDDFANTDRILVGTMGRENAEIVSIAGAVTAGTSLTTTALTFNHNPDEPVYKLRYDQVKFYRSTNGSSGSYSLLTTVSLDADAPDLTTKYDDTTGLATYFYKVSYYNSVTTLESAQSDAIAGSGYTRLQLGFLIDEVMRENGDQNNIFVDPTEMIGWANEVNDNLQDYSLRPWAFLYKRAVYGTTAGNPLLAYPTDMWKFDFMEYERIDPLSNAVTNELEIIRVRDLEDFVTNLSADLTQANNNQLQFIALDDAQGSFRLWPTPLTSQSNVIYIYYWAKFTQIDSFGDLLQTPTPRVYKLFFQYKFNLKKGANDSGFLLIADRYKQEYEREKMQLIKTNRKDVGSPRGLEFGQSSNGDMNVQSHRGYRRY